MKLNLKKSLGLAILVCMVPFTAFAQNITVKGVITDWDGETVAGASVAVQNTTNGTVTGADGSYSLDVRPDAILDVACVGYSAQKVFVQGREEVNVVLSKEATEHDALVVIGYGSARREDVTGSIATMGGETLRDIPSGEFSRALEGRIAGVQVTQTDSRPGASMEIRIRGQRSILASNDPLIVLDGVPFYGSLSEINPSDIKSLDILKDASATAVYGSRGANGVILVSTYRGVPGQAPRITFNNYLGIKKAVSYPMMSGSKYAQMRKLAGQFTNKAGYENNNTDTDWQNLYYRTAIVRNHELSINGGMKKGGYRFGVNYYKDESVVPTQDFDRYSLNGSVDQRFTDWLKVGISTNTNYRRNHGNQFNLYDVLQLSPLLSPVDENGDYRVRAEMPLDQVWLHTRRNINEVSDRWVNECSGLGTYNTAYVELDAPWVDGLSFRQSAGLNYQNSKSGWFTGKGVNSFDENHTNSGGTSQSEMLNWNLESRLSYDRAFGKHHLNLAGIYTVEQTKYTLNGISARNIPNEQSLYHNLGQCLPDDIIVNPNASQYWRAGLQSFVGRIMYSYADRYLISAAICTDATSRLPKGHQWHAHPSVSLGWNIHNEKFMSKTGNWLSELKLRAGYGETSNQPLNPYAAFGSLGTLPYNFGDTYSMGYYVSTLPNFDMGREYSKTWNFGLDFGFFHNRLTGSVEYYTQQTSDVLLGLSLPTSGGTTYVANLGSTENKGFEVALNGVIIDKGDWRWDLGVNLYSNRNKITSLASGRDSDIENGLFVGYPVNSLYDYQYEGIWNENDPDYQYLQSLEPGGNVGMIKVKYTGERDANGAPTRAISADDRAVISAEPNFNGGFNTRLSWKGLDLTVIGSFQSGGILVSSLHGAGSNLNMLNGRHGQIDVDYWTPENTGARYPLPGGVMNGENPKYASTLSYFDGSYFKIGTITLGYNFEKMSALKRAGIDVLRVYATVQNPGLVFFSPFHRETGLDPETNSRNYANRAVIGTNTPNTRNFIFGVNFTF